MRQIDSALSSFGELLKSFRKRQHLTQQQLAEVIGVHRGTLIHWEQGDFLPESKTMVLEVARHLHLNNQETRHLLEASLTALTPHWLVPLPRNPFFTGREEILKVLGNAYSVPSRLIGTRLLVRVRAERVEGYVGTRLAFNFPRLVG